MGGCGLRIGRGVKGMIGWAVVLGWALKREGRPEVGAGRSRWFCGFAWCLLMVGNTRSPGLSCEWIAGMIILSVISGSIH